jgi:heme-degrading monooxygenase HmoA
VTEIEKTRFAATPAPPYYTVAFSSKRTDGDDGYAAMADQMEELAVAQDGITNSFWLDEASIRSFRNAVANLAARRLGRERCHVRFEVRIASVGHAYSFQSSQGEDVGQQIH